ncbi:MAG: c-type cytochrome biogenesis protein CcmI [Burkholderiales bacterium]|nr:c-type cytochrome biogenesis protein CcmI [Burkholderiales bacterium]
MSTFLVVAAALTLAVIGALAVPLRRRVAAPPEAEQDRSNIALFEDQLAELERDRAQGVLPQAQFEHARTELGRRLLAEVDREVIAPESRAAPAGAWRFAALACVPIAAFAAYLVLGTPQAIDAAATSAAAGEHVRELDALTHRLRQRLEANPKDAEAAVLLARSLQLLGRAPEAVKAFAHAIELVPDAPQLYADYADVLVGAADGKWTPAASTALAKALALDPSHPKALWLAGTEAYMRDDFRTALAYWQKLAPLTEPRSEVARIVQQNIDEVRARVAGDTAVAPVATETKDGSPVLPAPASAVSGTITLDPKLAGEAQPADTVFVFARAVAGPKVPLAIRRIRVSDLPYRFSLGESDAMAPGMTIAAFPQVVIGARVSRSGDAKSKAGDLEGYSRPVKPGAVGVEVRIDGRVD